MVVTPAPGKTLLKLLLRTNLLQHLQRVLNLLLQHLQNLLLNLSMRSMSVCIPTLVRSLETWCLTLECRSQSLLRTETGGLEASETSQESSPSTMLNLFQNLLPREENQ